MRPSRGETVRMASVAIAGTFVGWLTFELLYFINPLHHYRSATTWAVEFAIGVLRQHALHRWFTFRTRTPYWRTLGRAFVFYVCCALLGTSINYILTDRAGWNYRVVWLLCAVFVAMMSYIFLKHKVFLMKK
jgi:hypothetical protein